jgi:transcriptional regulator with XRE-family HTH domain
MLDSSASSTSAVTNDVGARLKVVREQNGLSQRELAKRAGVTHSSISMIEQGQNSPSINSLEKILSGIPMTLAQFFVCDPNHSSQIVHRSADLIGTKQSDIVVYNIPHKNSAFNVFFQKLILSVGADTGSIPLASSQPMSGYIFSGQLELTANMQVSTLHKDDAFTLSVGQAYRFRNLSVIEECVLLICKA